MKYIVFILIMAACVWVYFNHSVITNGINNGGSQAESALSKEKTIFGVNSTRAQNDADAKKAAENY